MNCALEFNFLRRRHHCRACGGVFCHACAPPALAHFPGLPLASPASTSAAAAEYSRADAPVRACFDCVQHQPALPAQDLVFHTARKTELVGHLVAALKMATGRQVVPAFSAALACTLHGRGRVTVTAVEAAGVPEDGPGVWADTAAGATLQAPRGVPAEVLQQQAHREAKRRKRRDEQRAREQEERAALAAQRAAQREHDRKERVRQKKAAKRAKEAEEQAAAAVVATAAAGKSGAGGSARTGRAGGGKAAAAAAVAAPPCACGCTDYAPHPFKKTDCANCFHAHPK